MSSIATLAAAMTPVASLREDDAAPRSRGMAEGDVAAPQSSTQVSLSPAGRALAQATGGQRAESRNADIDAADLSDQIKDMLKRIRELQAQLQEKQRELAAVQADQGLTDEQKMAKVQALQTAMSATSSALSSAMGTLTKLMADQNLSDEQQMTVATLLMKG